MSKKQLAAGHGVITTSPAAIACESRRKAAGASRKHGSRPVRRGDISPDENHQDVLGFPAPHGNSRSPDHPSKPLRLSPDGLMTPALQLNRNSHQRRTHLLLDRQSQYLKATASVGTTTVCEAQEVKSLRFTYTSLPTQQNDQTRSSASSKR